MKPINPAKPWQLLEPEIQKRRDPALLAMAGVAAWRADDTKHALEYWHASLELAPNPDLEKLIQTRGERTVPTIRAAKNSTACAWSCATTRATVPVETRASMVGVVDSTFARVSQQLGCYAEEKIVTIIQSREAYKKATDAAEWSGGQYDGRIRVPVMNGQQMDARQEQVLAHETTHACLAMLGEWPSWLQEGMAQRLSGETLARSAPTGEMAKAGQLPKLEVFGRDGPGLTRSTRGWPIRWRSRRGRTIRQLRQRRRAQSDAQSGAAGISAELDKRLGGTDGRPQSVRLCTRNCD